MLFPLRLVIWNSRSEISNDHCSFIIHLYMTSSDFSSYCSYKEWFSSSLVARVWRHFPLRVCRLLRWCSNTGTPLASGCFVWDSHTLYASLLRGRIILNDTRGKLPYSLFAASEAKFSGWINAFNSFLSFHILMLSHCRIRNVFHAPFLHFYTHFPYQTLLLTNSVDSKY